jgi:hypothetical protein
MINFLLGSHHQNLRKLNFLIIKTKLGNRKKS